MIRERILKLRATDRGSGPPSGDVEIEVPGEQDGRVRGVSPGIFQGLLKLRAAQPVIPFAFEVQVIGDDHFPRDVGLADQSQAPSDSFLEGIDFRKKPPRTPEIRLPLKSEDAGIRQWPTRERALTVVGGLPAGALGQLLEFAPEPI